MGNLSKKSWLFIINIKFLLRIISIFALFEYVTRPRLNTLEEPLTDVIALDSIPPVQDSANEILSFFCISFLTSLLARFCIIKRNF